MDLQTLSILALVYVSFQAGAYTVKAMRIVSEHAHLTDPLRAVPGSVWFGLAFYAIDAIVLAAFLMHG